MSLVCEAQPAYDARADGAVRGQPYLAYVVRDSLARDVRFYISEPRAGATLPIIVYVHGSGHQSHFAMQGGRTVPMNGHATLTDLTASSARVLIVEKPGVVLFARGDSAPTDEFRFEHTLDRWAEAVAAATLAAMRLAGIDTTRLLIVGHSEGGLVAARVAARIDRVTHVALLAGGGPSQLFDLVQLARSGEFFRHVSADAAEREAYVLAQWDSIRADPESPERMFFGHPYRRWASFLASSPIAELQHTRAAVYIAQGERDRVVTRTSFDSLAAVLRRGGRSPTVQLAPGADHSFRVASPGAPPSDRWPDVLKTIVDWFRSIPVR